MYNLINGYTKKAMIAKILEGNKGWKSTRSSEKNGTCVYRASDGNKCAVGCFIPDELYEPEMDEGQSEYDGIDAKTLLKTYPKLNNFMPLEVEGLLELQSVHDAFIDGIGVSLKQAIAHWIENNVRD
jgi:hypothetical protein